MLTKAGYLPVLCDDPEKVVIATSQSRVTGDDLLMSAMHALTIKGFGSVESAFATELGRRMREKEAVKKP